MNPDGTDIQQLTTGPYWHSFGRWSPDTKRIVAMTGENSSTAFPSMMAVFNADGTNRKLLGPGLKSQMAWSPDGKRIAFTLWPGAEIGDYTTYIYTVSSDGTDLTRLTNDPGVYDGTPSWSPDGTRIAFSSSRDHPGTFDEIYLMNADGTDQRRLTHTDSLVNVGSSWSPDGNEIAFTSNGGIALVDKDGTHLRHITDQYKADVGGYYDPCWSPDDQRLVATWWASDGSRNIVLIDSDGTGLKEIAHDTTAYATYWSK